MKNRSSKLFSGLFLIMYFFTQAAAQEKDSGLQRCATTQLDSLKMLRNPALAKSRSRSEDLIRERIRMNRSSLRTSADDIVTIPVVVHVVHDQQNNRIGGSGNANITAEQIQSQIDVLNEDYGNTSGYKGYYTDSLAVDTKIRFKLVTIVRTYTEKSQFSPLSDADELAEISASWFTNRYLNIWVCRLSDRYLGTSQFPVVTDITDKTAGLGTAEDETDAQTDGVIIDFHYFGRNSEAITSSIYNLGRTTTHEVGHWLGLIHTWGDTSCGTDYCDDTPTAFTKNETTDLSCSPVFSDCNGITSRNMIENYMDYSPDACMSIFTNDQKERMHAVLELSPRRAKLVEYSRLTTDQMIVELYPNPVSDYLTANVFTPDYEPFTVSVYNQKGQKVTEDQVNGTFLNVSNFSGGIYFYKVKTSKETITKRFMVK
ncbi:T9SS type A sorting domain-containing protein [Dyadobacter flavalbus]|uniref:T9SS type A sorting domain-containing protein n=1 Tax=Dyadobacter flavalbus TaxID=2579942 RepID=A0A5M8QST4_9BACT|nr:M43 family zinc metalloprotease [Dyadobacter flavalbus]KAA6439169.1 T9SS type A sorting domain-containing protein [Dyadobacter flavalbus]